MVIVLKNSLGVEIKRQNVFHSGSLYKALRRFIKDNYIMVGYTISIEKS